MEKNTVLYHSTVASKMAYNCITLKKIFAFNLGPYGKPKYFLFSLITPDKAAINSGLGGQRDIKDQ